MYLFKEVCVDLPNSQLVIQFEWDNSVCRVKYLFMENEQWCSESNTTITPREGSKSHREWLKIAQS